jgi:hypothetical protein
VSRKLREKSGSVDKASGRSYAIFSEAISVSTETIGIKTADRTYYPILEKGLAVRKRLVLTTVKDHQENVQIDLYENDADTMQTAQYVGSLLIENIAPVPAGEAEIELDIGVDAGGTLSAIAREASSGEHQSFTVSLESLSSEGVYDIPEFELGDSLDLPADEFPSADTDEFAMNDVDEFATDDTDEFATDDIDEFAGDDSSFSEDDEPDREDDYGPVGIDEQEAIVERKRPVMLGLFIAVAVIALVAVVFLVVSLLGGPRVAPLEAIGDDAPSAVASGEEAGPVAASATGGESTAAGAAGGGPATAPPAGSPSGAGAQVPAPATASVSASAPVPIPPTAGQLGGTWYWIRRGDTLWDLSSSFYRNPWLFRVIAERNDIRNPDLIFAGSRIYIPSR